MFEFVKSIALACSLTLLAATAQAAAPFDVDDPPQGLFLEEWMEVSLMGQKVGYARITFRRDGDDIHTGNTMFMKILRGSVALEMTSVEESTESLGGEPLAYSYMVNMAGQPMEQEGTIADGQVTIVSEQGGRQQRRVVPYPEGALMTWGMQRKTMNLPLEPGASFTGEMFVPSISVDATKVTYRVIGPEEVMIRGQAFPAWKAQMDMIIGGNNIPTTLWVDDDHQVLKTSLNVMGMPMEMIRSDEATALGDFHPAEIFESSLITLNRDIPADATEVVYKVTQTNPGASPLNFPQSEFQQVKALGQGQYLVTVRRADHAKLPAAVEEKLANAEEYLSENLILDTQDPKVRELAIQAQAAGRPGIVATSDRMRKFVTDYIEDKNLSVGFATASEVAANPEGDCSEHAVLLAAMGRVNGIPSRVAAGLVYLSSMVDSTGSPRQDVMGYHMWTQFYIDGHWVDFDAAQDESECAPTRITLLTSSLQSSSIAELGLDLLDSIGQLEIEIVSVK